MVAPALFRVVGALAEGRMALVVGNSTYAHIGRLPNAENDATDISAALRRATGAGVSVPVASGTAREARRGHWSKPEYTS
ncbi:MAG: hypothetical protein OXG35_20300 [Acidobacteria bacterium]|nr:hypothetical protein [Acidobacteriota bacterium]